MLTEAFTVFLALIGTTLSCMNTGARVTYAMGKDSEVPEHFGFLHSKKSHAASGHLGLWPRFSAVVGCIGVMMPSATPAHRRTPSSGAAAGFLVQFRIHYARRYGGHAQFAPDRYLGV